MSFFGSIINYIINSNAITLLVLAWLFIYFLTTLTILISRISGLQTWISREKKALNSLMMGANINSVSCSIKRCANNKISRTKLNICISSAQKESTSGLTWLSIIASTSPFIGLFGTVISILETFKKLGGAESGISAIAPAISEALVATGAGIFVAIPAYTFHLIIKRKSYELMEIIKQEAEVVLVCEENNISKEN